MHYKQTSAGLPVLQDRSTLTGVKSSLVRYGYRDCDTWGNGLAMACFGATVPI